MSTRLRQIMATLTLALAASAGGCAKGTSAESTCASQGTEVELSGNHGHAVLVPADHVKRAKGGAYAVKGGDHEHAIVLRDEEMKKLLGGEPVKTRTSSVGSHLHEVGIACKK